MGFLTIIRPINLFLLVLSGIIIKYGLFEPLLPQTALNTFQFFLLMIAIVCIAAGGNVINDIFDQDIDKINKPNRLIVGPIISENRAYTYYFILNILGVACGFILANQIGNPAMAGIFIVVSALLYIYSSQLKGILLLGNFAVSLLVQFSLLIILLFDLYPVITENLLPVHLKVSKLVFHYSIFALVTNFIREIVKDIQDVNGDQKGGLNTLAISLGRKRALHISLGLAVLFIAGLILYLYFNFYNNKALLIYLLALIIAPLIYFCIIGWSAENNTDYKRMSLLLKVVMFTGICSIPLAANSLI